MGEELNFEKFRNTSIVEVCIDDAVKAEEYCVMEPKESIKSIRATLELAVKSIYFNKKIKHKETDNLEKLIKNKDFQSYINNTEIIESLFYIKKDGNQATHGSSELPAPLAIICLEMLYDFLRWIVVKSNSMKKCPDFAYSVIPDLEYNREAVISEAVDEGDEYYERMKNSGNKKDRKENENSAALYYNLAYKLGTENIRVLKKAAENSFTGISYIRDSDKTEVHLIGKNYKTVIDCAKKILNYKKYLLDEEIYRCYYLIAKCLHEGGYGADKDDYEAYDYIQECLSYDNIDLNDKNVEKIIEIKSQIPEKIIAEKKEKEQLKKQIDELRCETEKKIEELKQQNVSQNKIIETLSIQNRELSKQFEKILNEIKILKGEYNKTKINTKRPSIIDRYSQSGAFTEKNFEFDKTKGRITKYTGTETKVYIPEMISGAAVKSIGAEAFKDCRNIVSVSFPDSLTKIGFNAFINCTGLKEINIPPSITELEQGAFYACTGLTKVKIPETVKRIGFYAFKACSSLTSVTIPENITEIGGHAFYETPWIEDQRKKFEQGIVVINGNLIDGLNCKGKITVPDSVRKICGHAFYSCTGITEINVPYSVQEIGCLAFENCVNLKTAYIPKGIKIEDGVFPPGTKIVRI